jgi:hypothetical protein
MGIVPHGARTGDDKDSHASDEGTAPERKEDHDVEPDHTVVRVALNRTEISASVGGELRA